MTPTPRQLQHFYGSRLWRELAKRVIRAGAWTCAYCGGDAQVADHVVSPAIRWDLRFERSNLRAACKSCNAKRGRAGFAIDPPAAPSRWRTSAPRGSLVVDFSRKRSDP